MFLAYIFHISISNKILVILEFQYIFFILISKNSHNQPKTDIFIVSVLQIKQRMRKIDIIFWKKIQLNSFFFFYL